MQIMKDGKFHKNLSPAKLILSPAAPFWRNILIPHFHYQKKHITSIQTPFQTLFSLSTTPPLLALLSNVAPQVTFFLTPSLKVTLRTRSLSSRTSTFNCPLHCPPIGHLYMASVSIPRERLSSNIIRH